MQEYYFKYTTDSHGNISAPAEEVALPIKIAYTHILDTQASSYQHVTVIEPKIGITN